MAFQLGVAIRSVEEIVSALRLEVVCQARCTPWITFAFSCIFRTVVLPSATGEDLENE